MSSTFGSQFNAGTYLRDFQHASRIFVDGNLRLAPKYGFLFHVAFDLNPSLTKRSVTQIQEFGKMAKSVTLPKYTIDVKKMNAYNRPSFVQNKVTYDPCTFVFHDDSAGTVRKFWYDYYSYYYRDSDYGDNGFYQIPHKYTSRRTQNWGYTPRGFNPISTSTSQYINAIRIYSFSQKRFACHILINPMISSFRMGEHNVSSTDTMTSEMTVSYETVLYTEGRVKESTVPGFLDLMYDKTPSPLTAAGGGTQSWLGPGGIMDAASDVVEDLSQGNVLGAAWDIYQTYKTNKNADLGKMALSELGNLGMNILNSQDPFGRISTPSISNLSGVVTGGLTALLDAGSGLLKGSNASKTDGGFLTSLFSSSATTNSTATNVFQVSELNTGVVSSNGDSVDSGSNLPGLSSLFDPFPAIEPTQVYDDWGSSPSTPTPDELPYGYDTNINDSGSSGISSDQETYDP